MSISNIRTITPSLTDIKDYTPVLKIGDKYLVNGIGGDFIPVKGTVIEDATVTASDIIEGKTAYISSGKVTGTYIPSSGGGAFYKCSAVYQAGTSTPSTSSSQNFRLTIPPVNDYAASYDFYIQDGTATGKNRVWKIDKSKYPLPYSKVTSIYFRQIDNFWVLQTEDGIRFTSQSSADNPWDKTNWMDITTSAQCQFSFQMLSSSQPQGASWSGYKAILSSGKYSFSTVETTGLTYTSSKPVVGGIYTQDALAKLAFLYSGVPVQGMSVYIPFTQQASKAETGQTLSVYTGTPQYITYKGLQSIHFNNSIIECAVTDFPDFTNKWTVSLWFSSQNKTDDKTLMQIASSHNVHYGIRFVLFQNKICCDNITSSPAGSSGVSADFNINTWYHICATYADGTLKLYVNGQLQSTLNTTIQQFTKRYARIGGYGYGDNRFNGYITDFRIYNRDISASQVVLLYDMLTPTT